VTLPFWVPERGSAECLLKFRVEEGASVLARRGGAVLGRGASLWVGFFFSRAGRLRAR
jgi:hypothetical protein